MVSVSPLNKEIQLKVVYYGPGLGGKTTTLQHIHDTTDPNHRGKMVSLATPVERTLYFDYLPVMLPKIGGYTLKLQLFTVPGQIHFNATRKLVLSNADGVVFVADSQRNRLDANLESFDNLISNLLEYKVDVENFPILIQYNKRDLDDIMEIDTLDEVLNKKGRPSIGTSALLGENVYQGLELITKNVLRDLKRRDVLGGATDQIRPNPSSTAIGSGDSISQASHTTKGKRFSRLPLEDAVSKIAEDETGPFRIGPTRSMETAAATIGGSVDRPTIPAPLALTEKAAAGHHRLDSDRAVETPADYRASEPFSFVPFWPDTARHRALEIERAISERRYGDAMRLISAELDLIVSVHGRGMSKTSKRTQIAMLGLDDRMFVGIQKNAHLADFHFSIRTVLEAYLFLLQAIDMSR